MGTGSSGLGGGAKKTKTSSSANTPSGISYDQFMKMSNGQKYQTMDSIIDNPNIVVPSYLDGSVTTKVMYALGMNNKPTVVSDWQLDTMPGKEIYRTVYDVSSPPPYAQDIIDQIRTGDFTQLSGAGGSAHSRALYFSTNFAGSADYGVGKQNSTVMRAKINLNAKIADEQTLTNAMNADTDFLNSKQGSTINKSYGTMRDRLSLYAIANGYDGWATSSTYDQYNMIINRGVLTASSQNKAIGKTKRAKKTTAPSWKAAANK